MRYPFKIILGLVVLGFLLPHLEAQTEQSRLRIYEVETPDGSYRVDVSKITSISLHRYYVDGVLAIDELTVDTTGKTVARFYFADRNRDVRTPRGIGQSLVDQAQDKLDQVKEKVSVTGQIESAVVKSYPTTTHAHTVEYRVPSKDQLQDLYDKMSNSWRRQSSGKFKIE
ncbi:MAG: hypothetical protein AAF558_00735 [Verrucomicrobiota bacterium]